jgi:TetR/AcrR family transcriptional repressor of nem operon
MARTKEFDENEVLDKALNIFWCRGYNGTSMQELVEGLGISRSSLYDTYGDKHTLFLATLERYRTKQATGMIRMVENSLSVRGTIRDLFHFAVNETVADKLQRGCFMVNSTVEIAATDKEVAVIVNRNMQDIEDAFCRAIEKGQQQGEITTRHNARSLSRFIFNTFSGLRVAARSGADKQVFDDVVTVALSVLE